MDIRHLITAEYAVKECIGHVDVADLAAAIGKRPSFVYKTSDAKQPQQLTVRDALILDPIVHRAAGAAPFREMFIRNILGADSRQHREDVRDLMLAISAEIGQLAQKVREASDPNSDGGANYTMTERAALLIEAEGIQTELNKLFFALGVPASKGGSGA